MKIDSRSPTAIDFMQMSDRVARLASLSRQWERFDPTRIAGSVLDALLGLLELDFIGLRFSATSHIFLRVSTTATAPKDASALRVALSAVLEADDRQRGSATSIAIGADRWQIARVSMGAVATIGDIVAGSRRVAFPDQDEQALLSLAAMQAALACREIRAQSERLLLDPSRTDELTGTQLAESEHRLRLIIDTIPALVWTATPDGMVEFVNQYFLDYIGDTFDAVGGLNFYAIFHPDDRDNLLSTWQRTMASGRGHDVEGRIRRKDGEYRWFAFRQNPIVDSAGNVVRWYGVITDVEDRRRTADALKASQAALAASEQNLSLIIDSLPILAFSARLDGSADFINKQYQDYVGLPAERILDWGYIDCWHPDDVEPMLRRWSEDLNSDFATNRGRIRRWDGEYRWFHFGARKITDANGAVRWFGVAVDMEDLEQAELALKVSGTALRTSEHRLLQIISSIPGLVWAADTRGGTTFWSEQYLAYAGMHPEDVLGTGFHDHIHPDDRQRVIEFADATVKSGTSAEIEARLRRADGHYRWFLIRANPFHDENGALTQWFGVNIDIDDRIRAEAQLHQIESELARMTRVDTIGELALSIAHEINQPLMAVVTNASTCLRWLSDARLDVQKAREAAERVVSDGHRAGDIVMGLRAMVDKSPPRMERVDLRRTIEDVARLVRPELQRRSVALFLAGPDMPVTVWADRIQLQQVVMNLMMNGAEAMSDIGVPSRHLWVRWTIASDDQVVVRVADNGSGIVSGLQARMFDALFSTKPGGLGMGLAISRRIVEAHGGQISAANQEPHGCVVTFTLPLMISEATPCR
ncbi:hypothetical protein SSBR45G_20860 [Bradyrhizobium sp. SSBR45G]|uniref:PAS domain-containing sensor histidine kinase n=1 Tax=unclassified Bradyrhizobium TaxID=2631580 RepID=UPI002342B324|nr:MULTISPECIES: PAS domain S-box protein [unclassified Bradyrhizobium]GLH77178.1 hypothetical protein SSBR45G_20860 [Bradyrhizobium sp. SSBR45G]GLH83936.1 hypothetical protein SSBR45R_13960 [Bradyrhizobium sp. SSBR45R]